MNTIYYYPHLPHTPIESHPLYDLMYDLDPTVHHTQHTNQTCLCVLLCQHMTSTHTSCAQIISFNLKYNNNTWTSPPVSPEIQEMLMLEEENKPYLQLATYYLFWSDKKTNTKLF